MLVVISDLHLVDETAGRHNFSAAAFENVFLPHIAALARNKNAKEIKLLLLGDVFDFIHTEQWFEEELDDRPWGANGLADVPTPRAESRTAERVLKILGTLPASGVKESVEPDTILYRNWESLQFLRELPQRLDAEMRGDAPLVELHYLPGNHDRLVNLYPQVRDAVAEILGVTVSHHTVYGDPDGEWWFPTCFTDEAYGVFARHGQQFDVWNFGGGNDLTRRGHLMLPMGDVLGVEFGAKLPHLLERHRVDHPYITDPLIHKMREIALVRPFTHALQWLHFQMKKGDRADVRKVLTSTLNQIVRELLDIDFVQTWRNPQSSLDDSATRGRGRWLRWIPKGLLQRLDAEDLLPFFAGIGNNPVDPDKDLHLRAAYRESSWRENDRIHFIVYGHTHFPVQRPLDGEEGHEVCYINTGTWRDCIYKTVVVDPNIDFMKFERITYSIFYSAEEDRERKPSGAVSFETWSGVKKSMGRRSETK